MKRFARVGAVTVLALIFGGAGLAKLINPEMLQPQFTRFGLPSWFVLVTGAVEILGAVLIAFFKGTGRRFGAALLAVTMGVAASLHVMHDPFAMALPALALMLLSGLLAAAPTDRANFRHRGGRPAV